MRYVALVFAVALIGVLYAPYFRHGACHGGTLLDRFSAVLGNLASETGSLTLEAADAVLKDDYKTPVVENLNNNNVIVAQLERNTEDFTGRRWVRALHVGRNRGVGNRRRGAILPDAGNQRYDNTYGATRNMYATFGIEGKTIEVMAKSKGSFIRGIDPEMEGTMNDAKRQQARQSWGTSNGVIATAASNSTTTITLLTPRQDQLFHLDDGALIEIRNSAGTVVKSPSGGLGVASVNYEAGTIVIENPDESTATAVTIVSGDIICAYMGYGVSDNTGNDDDGQIELTGLQTMISDTTTLHTLAPATESRWKSRVYTNPAGAGTLRSVSDNLVQKAINQGEKASGKTVELLVGSDGVVRAYGNHLSTLKRQMDNIDLKGGFTGTSISAVKQGRGGSSTTALTWDMDAPDNSLWGICPDDISVAELIDWRWMDEDGHVLHRVGRTDDFEATMKAYKDNVCHRRNGMFVIKDLTEA